MNRLLHSTGVNLELDIVDITVLPNIYMCSAMISVPFSFLNVIVRSKRNVYFCFFSLTIMLNRSY